MAARFLFLLALFFVGFGCEGDEDICTFGDTKIIAPAGGGVYLGQAESMPGARASFESTTGKKVAIWQRFDVIHGQEEDPSQHALSFDVAVAQQAWDQGYIVFASAFEAYPGHSSFTVDKLLVGTYDADLATLAGQFKEFGRPMFFSTAREPNVILYEYMGGFGPEGDQSTAWAYENERTTGDFTPPAGPSGSPDLYVGLGDSEACDGLERLAAAQRYYYDFFVRREGIDFLTFDTMGWNADIGAELEEDAWTVPCGNLRAFHGMLVGYADWVSINTYFDTDDVIPLPTAEKYVADLDKFMNEVIRGGPLASLPVMITELGFCGADVPSKIAQGLDVIVTDYPEIGAVIFWGDDSNIGLECLVDPGPEADAFNSVMTANPDSFHSCVTFSDGTSPPGCP